MNIKIKCTSNDPINPQLEVDFKIIFGRDPNYFVVKHASSNCNEKGSYMIGTELSGYSSREECDIECVKNA